jgi:SAM-dependent methyltransferase
MTTTFTSTGGINPYREHALRYDRWFDAHRAAYEAELRAVRSLLPAGGLGVEVGAGTGRFAAALGIQVGVEPCAEMAALAKQRGIEIIRGVAEELPLAAASADTLLMVTVLCFVRDVRQSLQEAARALKPGGLLVVALLDRSSPLGQAYAAHKEQSVFYREATLRTAEEVIAQMRAAGFDGFRCCQTIFHEAATVTATEPVNEGHGYGLFAVIQARRA